MQNATGAKLDFLKRVTGTSNAQLARALSFDASYISRIRAGKRGLPPEQPFIRPASEFFSRNIRAGREAETIARELGLAGSWPDDSHDAARLLESWLADEIVSRDVDVSSETEGAVPQAGKQIEARAFFGNEGRMAAALAFLEHVARTAEETGPLDLLLSSDEDMAWLYEDDALAQEWSRLMERVARAGCTFTIIHTTTRDANEMWEGVRKWLPLYMTGTVRPYYYPRLRDGLRARSVFVAPGCCALTANSVRGEGDHALSALVFDSQAVAAMQAEFEAFLAFCRPLVEVTWPKSPEELKSIVDELGCDISAPDATLDGSLIFVNPGRSALVVSDGEHLVACKTEESHLVEAIALFASRLPHAHASQDA